MAKDEIERVERDADLPFEIPPFDEDEFVHKELISFRTTVVLFFFSLAVALLTTFIGRQTGLQFMLLLVFALACAGALPFLYKVFKIDIKHFRRREWIGTLSLHFFFWMGFTLLVSNPPIADETGPVIESAVTPITQGAGYPMDFALYIADNTGVVESSIRTCLFSFASMPPDYAAFPPAVQPSCTPLNWSAPNQHSVRTAGWLPTSAGHYALYVYAQDNSGRASAPHYLFFNVTSPLPTISGPGSGTFASLSDSLFVRPHEALAARRADGTENLRSVQYEINGKTYNMTQSQDQQGYWTSNPTFPGWSTGTNNVTLLAVEQPHYIHGHKLDGGVARATGAYRTYTVSNDFPDLNSQKEPVRVERPAPAQGAAPGLGWIGALGALVLVGGLRARREPPA